MGRFLTETDKTALLEAVKAVEARSSAEVVVVVRPQSASYLHVDLLVGIATGIAALAFLLFSPWDFSLGTILAGPVACGAVFALLVSRAPSVERWLSRPTAQRRAVRSAAAAAFADRGIHRTRGRTGILVYVSLLERAAVVMADAGVESAVPKAAWNTVVAEIEGIVAKGEPGRVLAGHLAEMGNKLEAALPRAADDIDELSDEVVK